MHYIKNERCFLPRLSLIEDGEEEEEEPEIDDYESGSDHESEFSLVKKLKCT